jgi:hypothetical protein
MAGVAERAAVWAYCPTSRARRTTSSFASQSLAWMMASLQGTFSWIIAPVQSTNGDPMAR